MHHACSRVKRRAGVREASMARVSGKYVAERGLFRMWRKCGERAPDRACELFGSENRSVRNR
jgi:hypothetical protein